MKYAGPGVDDLKLWKVTFLDGSFRYAEARDVMRAILSIMSGPFPDDIVSVEFDLCLHDNDWWDEQSEGVDCPFAGWS